MTQNEVTKNETPTRYQRDTNTFSALNVKKTCISSDKSNLIARLEINAYICGLTTKFNSNLEIKCITNILTRKIGW